MRRLLAYTVYGWLAAGMPLREALERGVALFPQEIDVGVIAVSRSEAGTHSNRDMPCAEARDD